MNNKRKLNDDYDCTSHTKMSKLKDSNCDEKMFSLNCKFYLTKVHHVKNADSINSNINSISLNGKYKK